MDTIKNKFKLLATFFCTTLGLRHPDEKTKKLATVIVLKVDTEPEDAYRHVREFGAIMDQKRSSIGCVQTLTQFPEDPKDFMTIYPGAYSADDPPVACRLDLFMIKERLRSDITPCRESNAKVKRQCSQQVLSPPSNHSSPDQNQQNVVLAALLQSFMMNQGAPANNGIDIMYNLAGMCRQRNPALMDAPSGAASGSSSDGAQRIPLMGGLPCSPRTDSLPGDDDASVVGGGLLPQCLQPPSVATRPSTIQDKLSKLSTDIAKATAAAEGKLKKRISEKTGEEEVEIEPCEPPDASVLDSIPRKKGKAKGKAKPAKSKVAASPKKSKTKSQTDKDAFYDNLFKKKPKSKRPKFCLKPTHHHGGKIYWMASTNQFRIYKRKRDRIDTRVRVIPNNAADAKRKFAISCAIIESDPRPVT